MRGYENKVNNRPTLVKTWRNFIWRVPYPQSSFCLNGGGASSLLKFNHNRLIKMSNPTR